MGVVYEVHDRERDARVALKLLRRTDPAWLYHFKQEFRALADVAHPNLVSLHELVAEDDAWFFTMELVDGSDLLSFVRRGQTAARQLGEDALAATLAPSTPQTPASTPSRSSGSGRVVGVSGHPLSEPEQLDRLRDALRQLAEGVHALHAAGKLHRDLKPSNVLVSHSGRVAILDFGLVTERSAREADHEQVVGTPAYMAPEQGAARELSPACDWYSVGVILYEALTGRVPFAGSYVEVLSEKQRADPPSPRSLVPDVPDDLDELCTALLARDPAHRPSGAEVLRRLGADPGGAPALSSWEATSDNTVVGRERQLAALQAALDEVRAGAAVVVNVSGLSGMGKSTLVRGFLERIAASDEPPLVLAGRCYERESVPYKAVDSVIDELSRELRRTPRDELAPAVTPDVAALGRLFPVLWRVEALAAARDEAAAAPDPHELRRRAFAGLRQLLVRLAERRAIVVHIDDAQWGDADSAALLSQLLRPPDSPPIMLIGCYRSDEADGPLVGALVDNPLARGVEVGPLSTADAQRLAAALLPAGTEASAPVIASESRGNPYFIAELARHTGRGESTHAVTLDEMLYERIEELPSDPRRLLASVAVAARPIGQAIVARAAGVTDDPQGAIAQLRAANLIRTHGVRDRDGVSTYHDRIRETVVGRMSANELAAYHRALAIELEASGDGDAESLAQHYHAAGDDLVAARHALSAADQAAAALAFDRAARLYQMTLELGSHDAAGRRSLLRRLGDALANAGCGPDAAEAYLAAAEGAGAAEALDLKRRAAEQFLVAGFVQRGVETVREVLGAVGMTMRRSRRGALAALLGRRLQLKLTRKDYTERDLSQLPPEHVTRIDVCWAAAAGLMLIDNLNAVVFATRHLQLALKAGEPYRIARGLVLEAGFLVTISSDARSRALPLLERAEEIAHRVDQPAVLGLAEFVRGVSPSYAGRWRESYEHWSRSAEIFRSQCVGVHFERSNVEVSLTVPLFYLGEIAALSARVDDLLDRARERRNHFFAMGARTGHAGVRWLAADDPTGAREAADYATELWSDEGVHLVHYIALAQVQVALYEGDGERAWAELEAAWPQIKSAGLLRLQRIRIEAHCLRARAALARAAAGVEVAESIAVAERAAEALEKEHMRWSSALARLARAGIAGVRGNDEGVVAWLRRAENELRDGEMALHEAAAKLVRGQWTGGVAGERLISEANSWMRRQKIGTPERMANVLVPGCTR